MDATKFWQYSIDKYGIDEVKDTCLKLQDTYGYNVNLLLFCMLCDKQQRALSIKVIAQIMQVIETSDAELKAHRLQRRRKKAACEISEGGACADDDCDLILKQELVLEAKQQEVIAGIFAALNASKGGVEKIGLRQLDARIQAQIDAETVPYGTSLHSYLQLMSTKLKTSSKSVDIEQQKLIDALKEHV